MSGIAKAVWSRWCVFWFEADYRPQIRLFSRALGVLFFWFVLSRTFDLRMAYSQEGFFPLTVMGDFPELAHHHTLLSVVNSMGMIRVLHVTLLASLLGMALGFRPGLCAFVAFVCEQSFLNRNVAFAYGVDLITSVFLFYLVFGDYRPDIKKRDWRSDLGSIAFRLAQLQICIIYGFAGLDKVKGRWWSGDALWYVFTNPQYAA